MEDYNAYYLALYGLHHSDSNPLLKGVITVFFDIYTILLGLITVASKIALFGELMNSLFGIPIMMGSLGGVFSLPYSLSMEPDMIGAVPPLSCILPPFFPIALAPRRGDPHFAIIRRKSGHNDPQSAPAF